MVPTPGYAERQPHRLEGEGRRGGPPVTQRGLRVHTLQPLPLAGGQEGQLVEVQGLDWVGGLGGTWAQGD